MLYQKLAPTSNDIRLVSIQPGNADDSIEAELILHDLNDARSTGFQALSYTWGDPPNNESITLNGSEFRVRPNLYAALKCLRARTNSDNGERTLCWIDAICINQEDEGECSDQVLRIPNIYRAAQTTVVWLGEGNTASDTAMDFMNANASKIDSKDLDLLEYGHHEAEFTALGHGVLLRPWWERIWIVQEVAVSSKIQVWCGEKSVPWDTIVGFLSLAHLYHRNAIFAARKLAGSAGAIESTSGVQLAVAQRDWSKLGSLPLSRLLTKFSRRKATKPVDKIYGLLGISTEAKHPALKPDYRKIPRQLFREVMQFIIEQSRKLDFIILAENPVQPDDLPSWVPNFTDRGTQTPFKGLDRLLERHLFCAAWDTAINVKFSPDGCTMEAQGVHVDTIEHLASYWNPQVSAGEFYSTFLAKSYTVWHSICMPLSALIKQCYGPDFPYATVLWKVLTADRTFRSGEKTARYKPDDSIMNHIFEDSKKVDDVGSKDLKQRTREKNTQQDIEGTLFCRRFMVSKSGYLGLVPKLTEIGDVVCVLYGCDTPIVLRPRDGAHVFIGECYVYGIMDGELLRSNQDNTVQTKCFCIK